MKLPALDFRVRCSIGVFCVAVLALQVVAAPPV
jgi:hypothetical protein